MTSPKDLPKDKLDRVVAGLSRLGLGQLDDSGVVLLQGKTTYLTLSLLAGKDEEQLCAHVGIGCTPIAKEMARLSGDEFLLSSREMALAYVLFGTNIGYLLPIESYHCHPLRSTNLDGDTRAFVNCVNGNVVPFWQSLDDLDAVVRELELKRFSAHPAHFALAIGYWLQRRYQEALREVERNLESLLASAAAGGQQGLIARYEARGSAVRTLIATPGTDRT